MAEIKAGMGSTIFQLRWTIEKLFHILKQRLAFVMVYQRTVIGQALDHGIKMPALIFLLCLGYESKTLRNMTYKHTRETLRNLFVSSSKFGQSPFIELLKGKFV